MIAEVAKYEGNGRWSVVDKSVMKELVTKNAAFPDISGVVFYRRKMSDGKGQMYDALVTIVKFADGSETKVINSVHDQLQRNPGETEAEFDERQKELGILYAFAKRLMAGRLSSDGQQRSLKYDNFADKLRVLVRGAYDCQKADELKRKVKQAKKAAAKAKSQAKAAPDVSASTVNEMSAIADTMREVTQQMKQVAETMVAMISAKKSGTTKAKKA